MSGKNEIGRELAKIGEGGGISASGKIAGAGIQFLYNIALARILGAEGFGVFILAITVANIGAVVGRLGLDSGVTRYVALYRGVNDKRRVKGAIVQGIKWSLIASIMIAAVMFLLSDTLAMVFNNPRLGGLIRWLSLCVPFFSVMAVALASTLGFQVVTYHVFGYYVFWPALNLLLFLSFAFLGWGLGGAAVAYGLSLAVTCMASIVFVAKLLPDFREIEALPETRELFRFSVPLLAVVVMQFVIMWTDTFMLGHFRSSTEVGIYNGAMRISMVISMALNSINAIFAPMISDMHNQGQLAKLQELSANVTKWSYMFAFFAFLIVATAPAGIMAVYGKAFVAGNRTLLILAFAQLINASAGPVGLLLMMSDRQDFLMYDIAGSCGLNVFLNYLLIPIYGITGAAIASGAAILVLNLSMLLEVVFSMRMRPYDWTFVRLTFAGVAALISQAIAKMILTGFNYWFQIGTSGTIALMVFVTMGISPSIGEDDRLLMGHLADKSAEIWSYVWRRNQ